MTINDKKYYKSLIKQGATLHSIDSMKDYFKRNGVYYITNPAYQSFNESCASGNITVNNPYKEHKSIRENDFYTLLYQENPYALTVKISSY